ncbi:MAG: hypothetical protein RLZZ383_285, partial [Pseudomonadota bacterium]
AAEEAYTDTVPTPDAVDTDPVANRAWDVGEPYQDVNFNGRIDLFDCDDTSPVAADRFPGNPEVVGDGIDQDCNVGTLDPSEPANVDDCFVDLDNDGFGTAVVRRGLSLDCTDDASLAKVDGDCRDVGANARFAYPGAAPQDSVVDCMMDRDGDLWGDRVAPMSFVETGFDGVEGTDCDDADAGDFPGAPEIAANGDDEDCDVTRNTADANGDGLPDGTDLCYVDSDNDGFGTDATVAGSTLDCTADAGVASERWIGAEAYVDANGNHRWDDGEPYTDADADGTWTSGERVVDCLDRTSVHADAAHAFPGAAESDDPVACMMDADEDGFGDDDLGKASRDTIVAAGFLAGRTRTPGTTLMPGSDCDDSSAQDKPGATELVGNLDDEDCTDDEICYVNTDRDLFRVGPTGAQLTAVVTATLRVASADMDCDDAGEAPAFYVAGAPARASSGATPIGADDRNGDCIDDPARHPQAAHAYPGAAETESGTLCMMDADADGYGDDDGHGTAGPGRVWRDDAAASDVLHAVVPTEGTVVSYGNDCDDSSDQDHPNADEVVGNLDDEDCDDIPGEICYVDADADGFRTGPDGARFRAEVDAMANTTGALTVASADMDCSGLGEAPAFYVAGVPAAAADGATPDGAESANGDCLDNEALHPDAAFAYPGAAPSDDPVACMMDADNDGFGDDDGGQAARDSYADAAVEGAGVLMALEATPQTDATPDTMLVMGTDCDDSSAQDFPGGTEIVSDGDDEDCDTHDDCLADDDDDNYAASGAARVDSIGIAALDAGLCATAAEVNRAPSQATPDCDDTDDADYPGATETIGNLDDEDCNGKEICYVDSDGDGYRVGPAGAQLTSGVTSTLWTASSGGSADMDCGDAGEAAATVPNGDCIDNTGVHAQATRTFPGAAENDSATACMMDADQDGYGDDDRRMASRDVATAIVLANVVPTESTTITAGTDCDDSSGSDNPAATEIVGNEDDDDCTNETEYCYVNADGDSYRVGPSYTAGQDAAHLETAVASGLRVLSPEKSCAAAGEAPRTLANGDCLDSGTDAASAFPRTNGASGWLDSSGCMMDADGDKYGSTSAPGTGAAGADCDDTAGSHAADAWHSVAANGNAIRPNASEVAADGIDQDCSGRSVGAGTAGVDTCYTDSDSDTFGSSTTLVSTGAAADLDCTDQNVSGTTDEANDSQDCLDSSANAFPGAAPNETGGATACMMDADGDDYASRTAPGTGTAGSDCDDVAGSHAADAWHNVAASGDALHPNATETAADGIDQDCSGRLVGAGTTGVDTCYTDADSDTFGSTTTLVSTGAFADLDCTDANVSGTTDEANDSQDCLDVGTNASSAYPRTNGTSGWLDATGCMMDADGDNYGSVSAPGTGAAGADCLDSGTNAASAFPRTNGSGGWLDTSGCMMDADGDKYGSTTAPGTGAAGADCDDTSGSHAADAWHSVAANGNAIRPNATETPADGIDQDCSGRSVGAGTAGVDTCYTDADSDTYGSTTTLVSTGAAADLDCTDLNVSGTTDEANDSQDCLDVGTDAASAYPRTNGTAGWLDTTGCMMDADADNYGSTTAPGTGAAGTDCDDTAGSHAADAWHNVAANGNAIRPNATDTPADGIDQNCSGRSVGAGNAGVDTCYVDADSDTFGGTSTSESTGAFADLDCTDPNVSGTTDEATVNTDCLDSGTNAASAFPRTNGSGGWLDSSGCMMDADGDKYGSTTAPGTGVAGADCDDTAGSHAADAWHNVAANGNALRPGLTDTPADGIDQNCSGRSINAGTAGVDTCYTDADSDTYGSALTFESTSTKADLDCTDLDASGTTDEANDSQDCLDTGTNAASAFPRTNGTGGWLDTSGCMMDADADNYGSTSAPGTGAAGSDCDDTAGSHAADAYHAVAASGAAIHPGATDTPVDQI